ncbi:Hypothetical protein BN1002_00994 [Bacillus sp. B-jedd]|nr:Hypothetical protein BN1002_00994 [Bacillus sp. B-jedd]
MTFLNEILFTEEELKTVLLKVKAGASVVGEQKQHIVKSMLAHIGSADSVLRDKLIYGSFCKMILEGQLEEEQLINLFESSLSESYLFKGIGEKGTDTVFTRSFTSLLIALILYKDGEDDILPASMVETAKERLLEYIQAERDLRGFVPGKGWAHSIAHAADAIDELVKNQKVGSEDFSGLLQVLWDKMLVSESVYIRQEEERVVVPIVAMLQRGLDQNEVVALLKNTPEKIKISREVLGEEHYWNLVANAKNFLKSLYIKSGTVPVMSALREPILKSYDKI